MRKTALKLITKTIANMLILVVLFALVSMPPTTATTAARERSLATWRDELPLSFDLMDDAASPAVPSYIEPILVPFGENVLRYLASNHPGFPVDNPTRPGYDFVGWYRDLNPIWNSRISLDSHMPMRDTTWYARWVPSDSPAYMVTFNMRSNEINPVTPPYIEPILVREGWPLLPYLLANHPTFIEEPTRERGLFRGWLLETDHDRLLNTNHGSRLLDENFFMPGHDVVLFAGW